MAPCPWRWAPRVRPCGSPSRYDRLDRSPCPCPPAPRGPGRRTAVVERLLDRDGVGFVDELLDEELDESFTRLRPERVPRPSRPSFPRPFRPAAPRRAARPPRRPPLRSPRRPPAPPSAPPPTRLFGHRRRLSHRRLLTQRRLGLRRSGLRLLLRLLGFRLLDALLGGAAAADGRSFTNSSHPDLLHQVAYLIRRLGAHL